MLIGISKKPWSVALSVCMFYEHWKISWFTKWTSTSLADFMSCQKCDYWECYWGNEIFYHKISNSFPAGIYWIRVNNGNTRTECDIRSKLTKTLTSFWSENPYNLIHASEFSRPMVKKVYHGTESIPYLGLKI